MLFNDAKALKGHLSLLVADDKYLRSQVEVKYPKSDRIDALLKKLKFDSPVSCLAETSKISQLPL